MFLTRLQLEWKYDVGRLIIKALRKKLNNRQRVLCLISDLKPELLINYNYSKGNQVLLTTLFPNIEVYINQYKTLNNVLVSNSFFRPTDLIEVRKESKSVNELFISNNGFYINPYQALVEFKTQVTRLCELMETSDNADLGNEGHNKRILEKHFEHLEEFILVLINLSLQKRN